MMIETAIRIPCLCLALASAEMPHGIARVRFLMQRRWGIIVEDFDPRRGNYLLFGLLALCFIPCLVIAIDGQR